MSTSYLAGEHRKVCHGGKHEDEGGRKVVSAETICVTRQRLVSKTELDKCDSFCYSCRR